VIADRLDRGRAALGLADHAEQASLLEHGARELVHARRRGRTGWPDDFVANGIDRAHVINKSATQIDRQGLAFGEHIDHLLVRGVAPGQHLAVQ